MCAVRGCGGSRHLISRVPDNQLAKVARLTPTKTPSLKPKCLRIVSRCDLIGQTYLHASTGLKGIKKATIFCFNKYTPSYSKGLVPETQRLFTPPSPPPRGCVEQLTDTTTTMMLWPRVAHIHADDTALSKTCIFGGHGEAMLR